MSCSSSSHAAASAQPIATTTTTNNTTNNNTNVTFESSSDYSIANDTLEQQQPPLLPAAETSAASSAPARRSLRLLRRPPTTLTETSNSSPPTVPQTLPTCDAPLPEPPASASAPIDASRADGSMLPTTLPPPIQQQQCDTMQTQLQSQLPDHKQLAVAAEPRPLPPAATTTLTAMDAPASEAAARAPHAPHASALSLPISISAEMNLRLRKRLAAHQEQPAPTATSDAAEDVPPSAVPQLARRSGKTGPALSLQPNSLPSDSWRLGRSAAQNRSRIHSRAQTRHAPPIKSYPDPTSPTTTSSAPIINNNFKEDPTTTLNNNETPEKESLASTAVPATLPHPQPHPQPDSLPPPSHPRLYSAASSVAVSDPNATNALLCEPARPQYSFQPHGSSRLNPNHGSGTATQPNSNIIHHHQRHHPSSSSSQYAHASNSTTQPATSSSSFASCATAAAASRYRNRRPPHHFNTNHTPQQQSSSFIACLKPVLASSITMQHQSHTGATHTGFNNDPTITHHQFQHPTHPAPYHSQPQQQQDHHQLAQHHMDVDPLHWHASNTSISTFTSHGSASNTNVHAAGMIMSHPPPPIPTTSTMTTMARTSTPAIPLLQSSSTTSQSTTTTSSTTTSAFMPLRHLRIMRAPCDAPLIKLTVHMVRTYKAIKCILDDRDTRKRHITETTQPHQTTTTHPHYKKSRQYPRNDGFDDDNDDYIVRVGEIWADRFQIQSLLGKGSFGQVVRAYDKHRHQNVAIKVIKNRPSFAQQAQSEIRLLQLIAKHDPVDSNCVVHMKEHFVHHHHHCIVYELLSYNLYEVLKRGQRSRLPLTLIRKFAIQLLKGLRFLSQPEIKIIHCDLKPENIMLVDATMPVIKIIDFGSSCQANQRVFTYIQSRYYRAPEVIMGHEYTAAIDMWSLGCVLVELLSGDPLFAGSDSHDQLCRICDVIGMPSPAWIERSPTDKITKMFSKTIVNASTHTRGRGKSRSGGSRHPQQQHRPVFHYTLIPSKKFKPAHRSLRDIIQWCFQGSPVPSDDMDHMNNSSTTTSSSTNSSSAATPALSSSSSSCATPPAHTEDQSRFFDLIQRMLVLDPNDRITPDEALKHPFFISPVSQTVSTESTIATTPIDSHHNRNRLDGGSDLDDNDGIVSAVGTGSSSINSQFNQSDAYRMDTDAALLDLRLPNTYREQQWPS